MHVSELPWRDRRPTQVDALVLMLPPGIDATLADFETLSTDSVKPKPEKYHDLDTAVDGAIRFENGNGLSPWILVEGILLTPEQVRNAYAYRHPNG